MKRLCLKKIKMKIGMFIAVAYLARTNSYLSPNLPNVAVRAGVDHKAVVAVAVAALLKGSPASLQDSSRSHRPSRLQTRSTRRSGEQHIDCENLTRRDFVRTNHDAALGFLGERRSFDGGQEHRQPGASLQITQQVAVEGTLSSASSVPANLSEQVTSTRSASSSRPGKICLKRSGTATIAGWVFRAS